MDTDDLYKFLTYYKVAHSPERLIRTSFPDEIKRILVVMGQRKISLDDLTYFPTPFSGYTQERIGDKYYHVLGELHLSVDTAKIHIDTTQWHVWGRIWDENKQGWEGIHFINSDLPSFLLFLDICSYWILTYRGEEKSRDLLERKYTQLKTQFEAIDKRAMSSKDNWWGYQLEQIKELYESYPE